MTIDLESNSNAAEWFDNYPVIGRLPAEQVIVKLRELGDGDVANQMAAGESKSIFDNSPWAHQVQPWQHTSHVFGYLAPGVPSPGGAPIEDAGSIAPDLTLRGKRVTVRLDRLSVAAYPGGGLHRVLFDFYAQNQPTRAVEHLHFNAVYRIREGEHAGVLGYPIFVGLTVGQSGIAFKCFTVNVRNDADEALLGMFESDLFKSGLKLATTVQPAIAPLSAMAMSLTKAIASRHRNVPVQDFYLGLDFGHSPTGAHLAEGAFIAVQVPGSMQAVWDWSRWMYAPSSHQVVDRTDPTKWLAYNYIIFSVNRDGEA